MSSESISAADRASGRTPDGTEWKLEDQLNPYTGSAAPTFGLGESVNRLKLRWQTGLNVAVFLASDAARYITGQVTSVNGGLTMVG